MDFHFLAIYYCLLHPLPNPDTRNLISNDIIPPLDTDCERAVQAHEDQQHMNFKGTKSCFKE